MESLFGFETLLLKRAEIGAKEGLPLALRGMTKTAKALAISSFAKRTDRPLIVITDKAARAEELFEAISFFLPEKSANLPLYYFPPWEILPYEEMSPHPELSGRRVATLSNIAGQKGPYILVTTTEAILRKTIPPEPLKKGKLIVEKGDEIDLELLADHLSEYGYRRVNMVEERGEFSIRGSIIDIFSGEDDRPVRLELFGDEVESVRRYNPDTQRSVDHVNEIIFYPFREVFYEGIDKENMLARFDQLSSKLNSPEDVSGPIRESLENERFFAGIERFTPLFFEKAATLFDYLPDDTIYISDEPELSTEHLNSFYDLINSEYAEAVDRKAPLPAPEELFISQDQADNLINEKSLLRLGELTVAGDNEETRSISTHPPTRNKGRFDSFLTEFEKYKKESYTVILVCASEGAADRLERMLTDEDEYSTRLDSDKVGLLVTNLSESQPDLSLGRVLITVGKLAEGVVTPADKWAVITDDEIFGRVRKVQRRERPSSRAFAVGVSDLKNGDLVAHQLHGVGRYLGAKELTIGESIGEYLDIEYAGNQKLLLPISNIHMVKKFVAAGSSKPQLDRMGGTSWQKTRAKVKKAIMEMAEQLLKLGATRKLAKGNTYSPDSNFHREFADSFEFEETVDQLASINDIAADMEDSKPMDRLICGDVGYGKTEVAMRAAFKAVYDGKQVAVLAPTTLLAQQHFQTFTERFRSFPVEVEVLSRFRTPKEAKGVIKKMEDGSVDIVIGTHRLLGKDVQFKDVGLVIIDEEQRFGVRHKERLKSFSAGADILTLTATPIPRTLHTALMGARDLSVIETPPLDRQSIRNFIVKFSEKVIKEAITREMDRGGQVFFVHNKVKNLDRFATYVKRIVPEARVRTAHGQMAEKELESVITDFVAKKFDVLVTTTIVESGLDIPSANTMIINRADHFGLSQLYQLRGRVGRDRHRAYCYFLIPGQAGVTEVARKRLRAVEELSELGSGFKLAARDMEIRGAGNLLGPEQSGHIDAVGFDTYCEMIEDAIREIRGEPAEDRFEVDMKLAIQGRIDPAYVQGLNQRMELYNRLHACRNIDELNDLTLEMKDRFGPYPEEVEKLVINLKIRLLCKKLKVERVDMIRDRLSLLFSNSTSLSPAKLITEANKQGISLRFTSDSSIETPVKGSGWRERFGYIRDLLTLIVNKGI